MMIEINYMATAAGSFYFLGLFLYYWHVITVLMLTDTDGYNGFKIMLVSIIWPPIICP
jgi:hypothetical protein